MENNNINLQLNEQPTSQTPSSPNRKSKLRQSVAAVLASAQTLVPSAATTAGVAGGAVMLTGCETEQVDPEVIDNSMEAKAAWLKSQQEKDPSIKLETSIKMDAIQQFRVKYEITDHPFKLQVKEIVLEKPLVNQLRQWSNEILAAATQGQPTMDDIRVWFSLYNNQNRTMTSFTVPRQLLFSDQDEVIVGQSHLSSSNNSLANTAITPTSFNADFAPRTSTAAIKSDTFWVGVPVGQHNKHLNENMNYSFPAARDFKNPFAN